MKNKLLILFFLLVSFTAQAKPGDDIWDNIPGINLAIAKLEQEVSGLKTLIAGIPGEKEVKKLSEDFPEKKGQPGKRGLIARVPELLLKMM